MLRRPGRATKFAVLGGLAGVGLVTAILALGCDPGQTPAPGEPSAGGAAGDLLLAIRRLESEHDPKCHSTACRFENFIYGTPLTDEARDHKVDLQKELILRVWSGATRAAAETGAKMLTLEQVQPLIGRVATALETKNATIIVSFPGHDSIEISPVRARQFASIAYSLRAILSVQQDALLQGGLLTPLDDQSTEALRSLIDRITLCALKLADLEARRTHAPEIGGEAIIAAWRRLVPKHVSAERVVAAAYGPGPAPQTRDMLMALVDHKLAAYRTYNDADAQVIWQRFQDNVPTYYARFTVPVDQTALSELLAAWDQKMNEFGRRLVAESKRRAEAAGHDLIRAPDAAAAARHLLPRRIDDFEDLHYFYHLEGGDRVTLESYDCDSFRDTGMHWGLLKGVYRDPNATMTLDPFAAEIITEAFSEYGVLLWRVAGRIASKASDPLLALNPEHLDAARDEIVALAERHHATPPPARSGPGVISAASDDAHVTDSMFFTDVTEQTGVRFAHRSTRWLGRFRRTIKSAPTFSGGGVAAEDINGDGWPDLLLVGGGGNALLLNDGSGRFRDVTAETGINVLRPDGTHGEARHPIICDLDNDGRQDILIAYANDAHRLYRNLGGMRFEDVTEGAGLGGAGLICGPVTVFDFDGDGRLDIYVTYFGDYPGGALPNVGRNCRNAIPNRLFRNVGSMRFEDVTAGSGTDDTGWAQGVSHTDFDRDGLQDIIIANDFGRNALLRNLGDGRFENVAPDLGVTYAYHSMNIGITDLNRDGFPDVYVSNIASMIKDDRYAFPNADTPQHFDLDAMSTLLFKESNVLYMSKRDGQRLVAYLPSQDVERGETSTGWAWDAEFFDFDNDGDDDLYVVNGANDYFLYRTILAVSDGSETRYVQQSWGHESNVFFVNDGGRLRNRSGASGADFEGNSRSTAYLDWDGDGDLDVAVNNFHGSAVMLRNNSEMRGNNRVLVQLIGDPARGVNRDAIGSRIVATNDAGLYLLREVQGGSGYMSMNPKRQHLGLGNAESVDLHITWPDGQTQTIAALPANREYVVRQGAGLSTERAIPAEPREPQNPPGDPFTGSFISP